ncbi:MAG: thioredoxin family protein [Ferruginibacter sp.]
MKLSFFIVAIFFSVALVAQPKSADEVLNKAYAQAKKENKNVILIFHASWCGWCKKMDASLQDEKCKPFFDKNYVIIHLTVEESKENKKLENPGADAVKIKYHGDKAGLPFWVILDKDGKLLGDSFMRKEGVSMDEAGDNIGCPASDDEVSAFVVLLKRTSPINADETNIIIKRFKENKAKS